MTNAETVRYPHWSTRHTNTAYNSYAFRIWFWYFIYWFFPNDLSPDSNAAWPTVIDRAIPAIFFPIHYSNRCRLRFKYGHVMIRNRYRPFIQRVQYTWHFLNLSSVPPVHANRAVVCTVHRVVSHSKPQKVHFLTTIVTMTISWLVVSNYGVWWKWSNLNKMQIFKSITLRTKGPLPTRLTEHFTRTYTSKLFQKCLYLYINVKAHH